MENSEWRKVGGNERRKTKDERDGSGRWRFAVGRREKRGTVGEKWRFWGCQPKVLRFGVRGFSNILRLWLGKVRNSSKILRLLGKFRAGEVGCWGKGRGCAGGQV